MYKENFFQNENLQKINKNVHISFIGSGNYATSVLIPAFKNAGTIFHSIASNAGVSGVYAGRKYGFEETTTDVEDIFNDDSTNALVIATRHNTHADFTIKALNAKKNIFVEKPLCINKQELKNIEKAFQNVVLARIVSVIYLLNLYIIFSEFPLDMSLLVMVPF